MASMPNAETAYVPSAKLTLYLLNPSHSRGWAKAGFLRSIGFDLRDVPGIEAALLVHGRTGNAQERATPFGVRYEVDGPMPAPSGRVALVRTVWHLTPGDIGPHFVTLIPL